MATPSPARAVSSILTAAARPDDADLLRRYRETLDPEVFEALVRRHAATVLGACRRVLTDAHAAEDAFQATFLQLARKSGSLNSPASLASWLYTTARRTALRHRRRGILPPPADLASAAPNPLERLTARELVEAIEEEIARLPEAYRLPLVLCYLDGRTKREAAETLGVPAGVLRGRLDRGREKLRTALVRRGLAPSAVLGLLVPTAGSASAELVRRTIGVCAGGEPSSPVVAALAAGRPVSAMLASLMAGLVLLGGMVLSAVPGRTSAPSPKDEGAVAAPSPRVDLYGDPLPPGAIARMGSIRWRHVDDDRSYIRVLLSPTGRRVATVGGSTSSVPTRGTARVWDLANGRQLCAFPWDDTTPVWNFRFTEDDSRLMVLTAQGVVQFHDSNTGKLMAESKPVFAKQEEHAAHIFSTEGRWVVSNRSIRDTPDLMLTEITTDAAARPRPVKLDPIPGKSDFAFAEFIGAGETLIGFCYDTTPEWRPVILRWDVRTGKLIKKTKLDAPYMVMNFSRDGKRVTTARPSGPPPDVLRVWDTETGAEVVKLEEADRWGYGMHISADGTRIIAGRPEKPGEDGIVVATVWELEHGKIIARVPTARWSTSFHLLPDGKMFLGMPGNGLSMFGTWDLATGRRVGAAIGHESSLHHLEFTPDGKTLLTASLDSQERVAAWDAATGKRIKELAAPQSRDVWFNARSGIPFALAVGGAIVTTGNGCLVWTDRQTGRELRRINPQPIEKTREAGYDVFHQEKVTAVVDPRTGRQELIGLHLFGPVPYSSDQKHGTTSVITRWDAATGELLSHFTRSEGSFKDSAGYVSPDGRLIARPGWVTARAGRDESWTPVIALEPAFGGRGSVTFTLSGTRLVDVRFTPDSQTLIAVTRTNPDKNRPDSSRDPSTVHLWEARSSKKRFEFALPFTSQAIAVSADGRFLASDRLDDKTLHIWELATGTEVLRRGGYGTAVETLAFRPDGKALASGHADSTALVWDLSGLPATKAAATDREAAWKDLALADAARAYRAIVALAADPDGVAFLCDHAKPAAPVPEARLKKLVADLGDEDFTIREAATEELAKLGDLADGGVRARLKEELLPEQRRRIEDVLKRQGILESDPDRLRDLRAIEALERAGTPSAREALAGLAKGAPGARLTIEASAAARRLGNVSGGQPQP